MKSLLSVRLFSIPFIFFLSIQGQHKGIKSKHPERSYTNNKAQQSASNNYVTITYYLHNHQIWYECNKFFFKRHSDVVSYYNKIRNYKNMYKRAKPKGAEIPGSVTLTGQFFKIVEYSYPEILKANPFSDHIWRRIWYGCEVNTFIKNNFQLLKIGFVAEINEYRRLHSVKPLKMDYFLSDFAITQSRRRASMISILFKKSYVFGHLGASGSIDQANLIVKKMYDTFMAKYNWYGKNYPSSTTKFVQLVWKKTKKVGVGVCTRGNIIYVSLVFTPKGGVGSFKKNVFPISQKHLYIYNLFRKNQSE
uniref:SCP domain-containing protein n=1 Tax=Strongyloides venezuelensis TaxID=75913 RepID=A0A0K0FJA7_STRVS